MLRAGPFSDQDVAALLNRRFVSFYFDLSNRGAAGDPAAREVVVAARPELGGMSVGPPTVLLMSPAGEVLGEFDNFASDGQVVTALLAVLDKHPEYAEPAPGESEGTPLQRARALAELQRPQAALELLAEVEDDAALLLRAQLLRKGGKQAAAKTLLDRIEDAAFAGDVCMEQALLLWDAKNHEALSSQLAKFPAKHARATEARYYHGLATFHQGDIQAAKAEWQQLTEDSEEDRWVYRADWAYSQAGKKQGAMSSMSSSGGNKSPLGRIGYMGRRNPDLLPRH